MDRIAGGVIMVCIWLMGILGCVGLCWGRLDGQDRTDYAWILILPIIPTFLIMSEFRRDKEVDIHLFGDNRWTG